LESTQTFFSLGLEGKTVFEAKRFFFLLLNFIFIFLREREQETSFGREICVKKQRQPGFLGMCPGMLIVSWPREWLRIARETSRVCQGKVRCCNVLGIPVETTRRRGPRTKKDKRKTLEKFPAPWLSLFSLSLSRSFSILLSLCDERGFWKVMINEVELLGSGDSTLLSGGVRKLIYCRTFWCSFICTCEWIRIKNSEVLN
jgi:hypothetical protein